MTRGSEGGRGGLRPAEWESWTLTHKPPMRLFVGLWARVQLSHPREARATALQRCSSAVSPLLHCELGVTLLSPLLPFSC